MTYDRYTKAELVANPSFIRWAEGEANKQEAEYWNRWVEEDEKNRELAKSAQQQITGVGLEDSALPDIKEEWKKVERDILARESNPALPNYQPARKRGGTLSVAIKVAAVLLIGAFVGLAAYLYQQRTVSEKATVAIHSIQTGYGEQKTIRLSDGSKIILAAKSKISYREGWLKQPTQRVSLKGEAFFAIVPQKAKTHPKFIVETCDGTAAVWGTQFTVDTYGNRTRVVLQEGDVRVRVANDHSKKAEVMMQPGEMARFSRTKKNITVEKVNPRVYTSWTEQELFFDHTPLSVLTNRIERTYGMQVEVSDPRILQKKLTGSVDFRSLDGLTDAVAKLFDIRIERSGETLIINHKMNR